MTTKTYFSLKNPRTRARLEREIFNSLSVEVYGEDTDRLEREERFSSVRTALAHLMHHQHYTSDVEMGERITKLRDAHNDLMALPGIEGYFGQKRTERLKTLMGQLMSTARECYNPTFTGENIRLFVELCIKGRAHFADQGYNPEEFVAENMVMFAALIAGNFEAYRATLNHEYVQS